MIVTEPNGIGFALGGLAGNAHGAGFLQAALDTRVTPEMISCTSGQLLWVWYYLRLLNEDHNVSCNGTLERRFQDELDKLSPLALIFDAVPTPWPSTEEFVRRAADLSRDWPFARDFTWWWLGTVTLIGMCSGAVGFGAAAMDQLWGVDISGGSVERGNLTPDREAIGHHLSVVGRRQQVPTDPEMWRNAAERRQEPLGMPG